MRATALRIVVALALLVFLIASVAGAAGSGRLRMPHPLRGAQITVGPTDVPREDEVTVCHSLKMPSDRDLAVNRVRIKVRGGSHHIHLYRPYDHSLDVPDGQEVCNFALDFDKWQLILASQTPLLNWKLPKGVAFHFKAGEQLLAQTHYVDVGLLSSPPNGWAVFNLYATSPQKVTSYAGSFFGQDRDVVVPPHSTATATTRCVFPRPVNLLALTGHYHFRGKEFTANVWDGTTTGASLYTFKGYTEPLFRRYAADEVPPIPGIEWTCTYQNDTDNNFTFGPFTDENEHCNLFAFYYPTVGTSEFMTCVQKQGVVTVKVGS